VVERVDGLHLGLGRGLGPTGGGGLPVVDDVDEEPHADSLVPLAGRYTCGSVTASARATADAPNDSGDMATKR